MYFLILSSGLKGRRPFWLPNLPARGGGGGGPSLHVFFISELSLLSIQEKSKRLGQTAEV